MAAGADNFARWINGKASELDWAGRSEGTKVAISDEVKGSDGAIERGGEDHLAVFGKFDGLDASAVLAKGDETEGGLHAPHFNLAVVPSGRNKLAVRRIRDASHVEMMALLLEDVGFTLPFPNE